ncbi:hypothetical protein AF335_16975 [Streptomyces eurocidicus]|uniref:Uncharacterized protein n=1 Tax=Streptomyces eurocidicus TaxID=66423 RepID=A0A2N8NU65_STREU|nr:hypothetical protein AF335_16975 [Streptomyces eurocidicus]
MHAWPGFLSHFRHVSETDSRAENLNGLVVHAPGRLCPTTLPEEPPSRVPNSRHAAVGAAAGIEGLVDAALLIRSHGGAAVPR